MEPFTKEQMAEFTQTCSPERLGNCLLAIYDRQTEDEKATEATKHHNKIGFNGPDAEILSSIAKFFKGRGYMSRKQEDLVRKKMKKYGRQLAEIANQKTGRSN